MLPAFAFLLLAQDLKDTHGKTNAQILAMGRSRWNDFYTEKEGGATTVAMSSAEILYGDALASRNDRLGKAKIAPLRKLLQDTARNSVEAGSAVTGGGTMWNIIGASLSADAEETVYAVFTNSYKGPKHVVSDVEKAFARLKKELKASDINPDTKTMAKDSLVLLRKNLDGVLREASRRPRRSSDALLDFCVRAVSASQM